jgi:WD40 repeat protein
VAISPDDQTLATASQDGTAKLWDLASGQLLATARAGQYGVGALAFTPDGKTLLTGDWSGVKLWDATAGQPRGAIDSPKNTGLQTMSLTPDGKTVAVGFHDGQVAPYDLESRKQLRTMPATKGAAHVSFTPDGRALAVWGQQESAARIWDLTSSKDPVTVPWYYSWALAPDGRTAAIGTGEDGNLRVMDLATGQVQTPLEGHTRRVDSLAYSADGRQLASASMDGHVIVWEPGSRKRRVCEWKLPGAVVQVAFASDGRHLVTVNGNGTAYLLRLNPSR